MAPKKIVNQKEVHQKSDIHKVEHIWGPKWVVTSGRAWDRYYVTLHEDRPGGKCDCDWGTSGGRRRGYGRYKEDSGCSHVQAVMEAVEAAKGRRTSAWGSTEDAKRQHRPILDIGDGVVLTSRLKG
jgi:hypothetical protein